MMNENRNDLTSAYFYTFRKNPCYVRDSSYRFGFGRFVRSGTRKMSAKDSLLDGEKDTFAPSPNNANPLFHERGGSPREVSLKSYCCAGSPDLC